VHKGKLCCRRGIIANYSMHACAVYCCYQ